MRRVREDHLHRTIVRCQRTAFKVQSDTHPAKSRCGDLSCNDPVSPEQTACPATDASNGGSSRDPREVRVLLGAAKRRFVQREPPALWAMHHAAKTMRGGSRFHKYEENIMNANIDYLGLLTLLRRLLTLELISDSEAKKIAARLRVDMGADIANFL